MRQLWWCVYISCALVGCGAQKDEAAGSLGANAEATSAGEPESGFETTLSLVTRSSDGGEAESDPSRAANAVAPIERKIIYTADVTIVVEDFSQTEKDLPELVRQFDGYLAETAVDRTHGRYRFGRWTARIPVAKYDEFLKALEGLGVPEQLNQKANDVTEEFVDLEARIANKKRLEERILKLLEDRSGKIKDVIEVERELARVRSEIEQMEGRLRYLKNQTSLTTVKITAREERDYVPPQAPTFGARISQTWTNSLVALRQAGEGVTIFAVAAAPWLVFVVPALWLIRWCWRRRRQASAAKPDAGPQ